MPHSKITQWLLFFSPNSSHWTFKEMLTKMQLSIFTEEMNVTSVKVVMNQNKPQTDVLPARTSPTSFWFVSKTNTWIAPSPPAASPCVTSFTSPSDLVKTHCFKERLYGFLSPTLLKDGSSPDNTSSPCDRRRDGALNAALISAFLSRSQGTAGSEKPDISQLIRFSKSFFYKTKIASAFAFL